jgi:3-hydroxyisobutyrate dehydrogenase-like beta-hydroxyacid dehydrogenase
MTSTVSSVGFLHPGQMGVTLAANLADGVEKLWAGEGRSPATAARADEAGLTDANTLDELCRRADVVISICPPAAAVDLADQVAASGFDGLYVDANAVSPATSVEVAKRFGRFVDGGVIGPPALKPGTTRMYLAGAEAASLVELWSGSTLDVRELPEASAGAASALKMAYAGWTKGSAALLLAINALARSAGVSDALMDEWELSQPDLGARSAAMAKGVAPKGWRFEGEMHEIADTFASAGLPDNFHRGAAEVYRRLAGFKLDETGTPATEANLESVVAALLAGDDM